MTDALSTKLQRIQDRFADSIIELYSLRGEDTLVLSKSALRELAVFLKTDSELHFNVLMDITAVDHLPRKPRFEVVYHFVSLPRRQRLRVKVPTGGLEPEVDSLVELWPSANWYEREVWDMFGIRFREHPDLRRILLYPEFKGHPLRKDYPVDKRQPIIGPQD